MGDDRNAQKRWSKQNTLRLNPVNFICELSETLLKLCRKFCFLNLHCSNYTIDEVANCSSLQFSYWWWTGTFLYDSDKAWQCFDGEHTAHFSTYRFAVQLTAIFAYMNRFKTVINLLPSCISSLVFFFVPLQKNGCLIRRLK